MQYVFSCYSRASYAHLSLEQAAETWLGQFEGEISTSWDFTAIHVNKNNIDGVKADVVSSFDSVHRHNIYSPYRTTIGTNTARRFGLPSSLVSMVREIRFQSLSFAHPVFVLQILLALFRARLSPRLILSLTTSLITSRATIVSMRTSRLRLSFLASTECSCLPLVTPSATEKG